MVNASWLWLVLLLVVGCCGVGNAAGAAAERRWDLEGLTPQKLIQLAGPRGYHDLVRPRLLDHRRRGETQGDHLRCCEGKARRGWAARRQVERRASMGKGGPDACGAINPKIGEGVTSQLELLHLLLAEPLDILERLPRRVRQTFHGVNASLV